MAEELKLISSIFNSDRLSSVDRSCTSSTQSSNEFSADIPLKKPRSGAGKRPNKDRSVSLVSPDSGDKSLTSGEIVIFNDSRSVRPVRNDRLSTPLIPLAPLEGLIRRDWRCVRSRSGERSSGS